MIVFVNAPLYVVRDELNVFPIYTIGRSGLDSHSMDMLLSLADVNERIRSAAMKRTEEKRQKR